MIFNIPIGLGKADCLFSGAVSETLTIKKNGTEVASVDTGSDGLTSESVELSPGEYTVTGSVSGYTRTVKIKKTGTYNAHPDGALYWYGHFVKGESFTAAAIKSADESYATGNPYKPVITVDKNNVKVVCGTSTLQAGTAHLQKVDLKAGTVKINYTSTRINSGRAMVFASATNKHENTAKATLKVSDNVTTATMTLSSDATEYVGVEISTSSSGTKSNVTIYSIVNEY